MVDDQSVCVVVSVHDGLVAITHATVKTVNAYLCLYWKNKVSMTFVNLMSCYCHFSCAARSSVLFVLFTFNQL